MIACGSKELFFINTFGKNKVNEFISPQLRACAAHLAEHAQAAWSLELRIVTANDKLV